MTTEELKQAIKKLLQTSKISGNLKNKVIVLMDSMNDPALNSIYTALLTEKEKMDKIAEKKKLLELKYSVLVENLSNLNTKK